MHNVNLYSGPNDKPEWNPNIDYMKKTFMFDYKDLIFHYSDYPIYVLENAFSSDVCDALIREFDVQNQYAVGVDGYVDPNEQAGSYRAMAWSESFAKQMSKKLNMLIDEKLFGSDGITLRSNNNLFATPFQPEVGVYKLLGSTPWLRFMKYASGGKHTPHYDAPFHNKDERYITLFSWVLYLNTPDGTGGSFQFVRDGQESIHPRNQKRDDWTHMSERSIFDVEPERGKLLVFPHWLCHQVEEYLGEGYRYIIRGDVAYGF